ncbi:hypothetical protein, partial [Paraeggerthella sp.]|uniref:hypothetical protein n=1 Tax=Paraeggerthella sp. TaxID=2897350 RepID=UPI003A937F96
MIADDAHCTIGHRCFFNNNCSIDVLDSVSIGDDCLFAEGVKIYDSNHVFNRAGVPIREQGSTALGIEIGN